MNSQGREQQIITETAAEWVVRLHAGDLDAAAQAQLEQWLAADERHAPALQFAKQTWAALGSLAQDPEMARPA
ncbi:FecR/PupR family sigma factor regulator, partial [Pseudomonas helleri]